MTLVWWLRWRKREARRVRGDLMWVARPVGGARLASAAACAGETTLLNGVLTGAS